MDYFIEEFNSINSKFTIFMDEHKRIKNENISLYAKIDKLESTIYKLNQEYESYGKVSVVKNLHHQIFEKDNFIKLLERKINKLTNKSNLKLEMKVHNSVVEVESDEVELEVEEVEVVEVEEVVAESEEAEEVEADEVEEEVEADEVEVEVVEVEAEVVEADEVEVEADEVEAEADEVEIEEAEDEDEVEEVEVEVEVEAEDEVEEDTDDNKVEVESEDALEVEEVEFIEKKLKPPNCKSRKLKLYLITDDEYKDIYERMDDGEPGDHVGKLVGKQNKPFFFVNKI